MANVEQFEKVVTEAGAVAMRIMRGPRGAERLIIQTPGSLITREVPLRGDLGKDIPAAAISATGNRRRRQTPYRRAGHKLELVAPAAPRPRSAAPIAPPVNRTHQPAVPPAFSAPQPAESVTRRLSSIRDTRPFGIRDMATVMIGVKRSATTRERAMLQNVLYGKPISGCGANLPRHNSLSVHAVPTSSSGRGDNTCSPNSVCMTACPADCPTSSKTSILLS